MKQILVFSFILSTAFAGDGMFKKMFNEVGESFRNNGEKIIKKNTEDLRQVPNNVSNNTKKIVTNRFNGSLQDASDDVNDKVEASQDKASTGVTNLFGD